MASTYQTLKPCLKSTHQGIHDSSEICWLKCFYMMIIKLLDPRADSSVQLRFLKIADSSLSVSETLRMQPFLAY